MIKSIKLAAALLATGLALGTYTASSASAEDAPAAQEREMVATASETYKSEANGECLDGLVYLSTWNCDGSSEQKWTVTKWNDGTVRFKNVRTGKCISDSDGSLGMAGCTTSKVQSWYVKHWNDGTMRFKNQGTGQCIEANSAGDVWSSTSCDSSRAQSWY
jgi:hypothetical protein